LDLLVQPFDFRQSAGFWGLEDDPKLACLVHAVLGGTPAYRDLLRGEGPSSSKGFDRWVVRCLLDPTGALFREGRYLMAEEPRLTDRALYHSILTAVVEGRTRPGQIAATLHRPQTSLAHPFNVLEDIGLIRREEDPLRSKRTSYRITEPIVRFYHVVIRPHLAALERRVAEDVWAVSKPSFAAQILGPHFEEMARFWVAHFASRETLGEQVGAVGTTVVSDPQGRATHQIDVVATAAGDGGKVLALGEAKWRNEPMKEADLDRLVEARRLLDSRQRVNAAGARLLLFSPAGFTAGLRRRASRSEAVLVDLERMYRGD
jgi:DNA-binding MarR family transcriptional regulator